MKVIAPFTSAAHPLAVRSLPAWVERVDVSREVGSYWQLLDRLWREGETFLVVEHDIEITPEVVEDAKACAERWCVWPYVGPGGKPTDVLEASLGCTRFSAQLLAEHPEALSYEIAERDGIVPWRRLDVRVSDQLSRYHLAPHVHERHVLHHHVYKGRCVCGVEHEAYPVDNEGRYRA